MQKFIKCAIDELTRKRPAWDIEVSEYLENDEEKGKESFDQLTETLLQIVAQIRDQKNVKDNLEQMFLDYKTYKSFDHIMTFLWNRISVYSDYSLLRDICQTDKYKAQKIVDIIWEEHIYRFNPYLSWQEKMGSDDESMYDDLANRLDKYVAKSVRYSLTFDAMVESLKQDSELPEELCRYIAKKIDENMKELKMNYILDKLIRLEGNIEALLPDDSTDK